MEDSTLQSSALNPHETASSFPPHCRRPIRSRTYSELMRILKSFPQLPIQVGGELAIGPVTEDGSKVSEEGAYSKAAVISSPDSQPPSEDTLVGDSSIIENKENPKFQDGDSERNQEKTPELVHMRLETEGSHGVAPENIMSKGNLSNVVNQKADCAIQVSKEQGNASNIVLGDHADNLVPVEELEVDKEFSIADYSDVLDSCFGMDMVIESSNTDLEQNIPKETEHELRLKEMELQTLIYNQNADQEYEEGEISGEIGAADVSFHEPSSVGDRTTATMHTSENVSEKEEFMCMDEDNKGCRQHQVSDPSLVSTVNSDGTFMNVESARIAGVVQNFHPPNVSNDSHMEALRSGPVLPCSEKQCPSSLNLHEKASENQMHGTVEKGDNDKRKKRRNGPLTKEKRDKKKRKDRLKRAEKNRLLGVKRLKLQPVQKQKTITYCRHFLHGRCHEGEKCKFSHDTVPLTKSKPCGHFARHSCMKGNDCPYDHQLSKYPCNNYTTHGFCSRGPDCLFSHEMPAKQSVPTTPTPSKPSAQNNTTPDLGKLSSKVNPPEVNVSTPLNNSNTNKHTVNAKTGSITGKCLEPPVTRTAPRTTTSGQVPKGISFLSNEKTSLVGPTNIANVGCSNEPNKTHESAPQRKPRGINFLSFARPTTTTTTTCDDNSSSNNILSKLLPNCSPETRKSIMDGLGDCKAACFMSESVGALTVVNNSKMNHDESNSASGNFSSLPGKLPDSTKMPSLPFHGQNACPSISFRTPFSSSTPSSVQKAVQSTLAFATSGIRVDMDPSSSRGC